MTRNSDVIMLPVVSKQFCSALQSEFLVRKRPCAVNGGGFVVTDRAGGNEVFRVEGCGPLVKHQAVLKDGEGKPILTLKRKVGVVEVFSFHKQWKGFVRDEINDGQEKPIFKVTAVLKDGEGKPILTLKRKVGVVEVFSFHKQWKAFVRDEINDGQEKPIFKVTASSLNCSENHPIRVSLTNPSNHKKRPEYEIVGSFTERACGIYDDSNSIVAEVKVNNAITKVMGIMKDIYSVVVQPGVDQAFVFGLVAVLDKITGDDS